jgi:hypothetical protein
MPKKGSKIDVSEKEWAKIKTEYIKAPLYCCGYIIKVENYNLHKKL